MLHVAEMLTHTKRDLTEALFLFLMATRLVQTTSSYFRIEGKLTGSWNFTKVMLLFGFSVIGTVRCPSMPSLKMHITAVGVSKRNIFSRPKWINHFPAKFPLRFDALSSLRTKCKMYSGTIWDFKKLFHSFFHSALRSRNKETSRSILCKRTHSISWKIELYWHAGLSSVFFTVNIGPDVFGKHLHLSDFGSLFWWLGHSAHSLNAMQFCSWLWVEEVKYAELIYWTVLRIYTWTWSESRINKTQFQNMVVEETKARQHNIIGGLNSQIHRLLQWSRRF